MNTVFFPGLGLEFTLNRVAIPIPGHPIYWYGIIIACGFLLAFAYCWRRAPAFGVVREDIVDMLLYAVPLSIIGARIYYIIFYLDLYKNADGSLNFLEMVRIWDGGLAIYGAVIAAVITLLVFTRVKGFSFFAWADMGVFGLLIGQCVGRWGNFVNVEAYGGPHQPALAHGRLPVGERCLAIRGGAPDLSVRVPVESGRLICSDGFLQKRAP